MNAQFLLGIDVGSQSVKACLLDEEGKRIAAADAPCSLSYPRSGWAEQDPRDWQQALVTAVREVLSEAGVTREDRVTLGLACQVDGIVAADADHQPLRPAIIWMDRRATRQTAQLDAAVGTDRLRTITGLNPDSSHSGPKAMWLRDNEPTAYADARWLPSACGYLNGWLTGEVVQDHANASSSLLYDLKQRDWSDELLDAAGLEREKMPRIAAAHAVIGTLRPQIAQQLGLNTNTEVVCGTGDDHGAVLGAGGTGPGAIVDVTGTAEPVAAPVSEVVIDKGLVETHAHAVDGILLLENPGFVSGGSVRWLAELSGKTQPEMLAGAASAPAGSGGAIFIPALSGSMAPRWDSEMRGTFAGLGLDHDLAHMARAVLEGCAFALKDIVDRLAELGSGGDGLNVVGGGARSDLWLQIKADVTGREVSRVLDDDATSAGAAMLAGVAAGSFSDLDQAVSKCVGLDPTPVLPDPANAAVYEQRYREYRELFDVVERWTPREKEERR